ncbi:MAG: cytochrome c [Betaproteobacteria bacterium]
MTYSGHRACVARLALLLGVACAGYATSALAEGARDLWRSGDAKLGAPLVQRDCVACHARAFDGDTTRIYVRPERKVKTPAQLAAQISYCNTQLGAGYFPDEEEHIAAYLNEQYYHFP